MPLDFFVAFKLKKEEQKKRKVKDAANILKQNPNTRKVKKNAYLIRHITSHTNILLDTGHKRHRSHK